MCVCVCVLAFVCVYVCVCGNAWCVRRMDHVNCSTFSNWCTRKIPGCDCGGCDSPAHIELSNESSQYVQVRAASCGACNHDGYEVTSDM